MWYAVYDKATGDLKGEGSQVPADKELAAKGYAKKEYPSKPNKAWDKATLDLAVDIPIIPERKQHKEFLLRFKFAEHEKLRALSKTDIKVEVWIERMELREQVDQTTPEFKQGMIALVKAGVLTVARAKAIGEWS